MGSGICGMTAILQEKEQLRGKCVATAITGGNVDRDVYIDVLRG